MFLLRSKRAYRGVPGRFRKKTASETLGIAVLTDLPFTNWMLWRVSSHRLLDDSQLVRPGFELARNVRDPSEFAAALLCAEAVGNSFLFFFA